MLWTSSCYKILITQIKLLKESWSRQVASLIAILTIAQGEDKCPTVIRLNFTRFIMLINYISRLVLLVNATTKGFKKDVYGLKFHKSWH